MSLFLALEGCLTVHLPHEIISNANLMQQGNFINVFLARHGPRRRWVDNIRMDLQEVGCGYVDWIGLAQDRDGWRTLVSAVMNLRFP